MGKGLILGSVNCPHCHTNILVMFNENELDSDKSQHFHCSICEHEDTIRFVRVEAEPEN